RRPSGLPDRLWTAAGSASSPQPDLETSHHLRRAFLVGAASLVVLADGWGVRQAVQNRAAVLGGTLQLTEREARLQPVALESSVTMLRLNWRTEGSDAERFRAPAWLNTNKITELGFDCGVQLKNDLRARRHYGSQPPRQVFLVMAYRGDTADSTDPRGQAKTGLVVVDAGRDPRQLRERYPDPQEYIICRGLAGLRFRTHDHGGGLLDTPVLEGFIADACPAEASVPKPINRVLLAVRRTVSQEEGAPPSEPRFSAWIHWGRNYEPWVDEVRALSK
ncbi:MAG: DUF4824 family protein, partial [Verrucomicrobia bacterium]|nr:DUF4824 family protein [Verrucomicrobiota bacterium]